MAANRLDPSKASAENGKPAADGKGSTTPPEAAATAAPTSTSSGLKAWLPLLFNLLLMPAVAYAVTTFVLLPKLKPNPDAHESADTGQKTEAKSHDSKKPDGAHGKEGGKGATTVALPGKVLVNVAGTLGTRYLLANMTLVGKSTALKGAVENNEAQLRDAASSALASKTIADLEKPGARNLIRSELISVFNSVLGAGTVTELYLTEFAIQ